MRTRGSFSSRLVAFTKLLARALFGNIRASGILDLEQSSYKRVREFANFKQPAPIKRGQPTTEVRRKIRQSTNCPSPTHVTYTAALSAQCGRMAHVPRGPGHGSSTTNPLGLMSDPFDPHPPPPAPPCPPRQSLTVCTGASSSAQPLVRAWGTGGPPGGGFCFPGQGVWLRVIKGFFNTVLWGSGRLWGGCAGCCGSASQLVAPTCGSGM